MKSSSIIPPFACGLLLSSFLVGAAPTDLASLPKARDFAERMAIEHGFVSEQVLAQLARTTYQSKVIRLVAPAKKSGLRSWRAYRARFVEPVRLRAGLEFWSAHRIALERAEQQYGVPADIVLGIIGVETVFGRNTGAFPLLDSLATLAFDYPPREALFQRELEQLFLLARESGRSPASYTGSYAGAIGYPQFLPSSIRRFAVDFDADGSVDLERSAADAIGSVARYLSDHGWRTGERIAEPVALAAGTDPTPLLAAGIEPALDGPALAEAGLRLPDGIERATLLDLETPGRPTEYWLGYRNFYVLTRYNRSSFYAMAVFHLAAALREARLAVGRVASDSDPR